MSKPTIYEPLCFYKAELFESHPKSGKQTFGRMIWTRYKQSHFFRARSPGKKNVSKRMRYEIGLHSCGDAGDM